MSFLVALWLPIVISGIVLFFASFVSWTKLPHHKTDWRQADNEEALMDAIRKLNLPPGNYLFPHSAHGEDARNEAFMAKYKAGPRGILSLWDMPNMAANMACTALFFLATAAIIAYVAYAALGPGVGFLKVFQVVGTIGVLTYSAAGIPNAIWFKRRMITDFIDGVAYGLIVGLIFAGLWPSG